MQEEIDSFLSEDDEKKKEGSSGDVNPFLALFGYYENKSGTSSASSQSKEKKPVEIKREFYGKNYLKTISGRNSKNSCI